MNPLKIASFIRWRIILWRYVYALVFLSRNSSNCVTVASSTPNSVLERLDSYYSSLVKNGTVSLKEVIGDSQINALRKQLALLASRYAQNTINSHERNTKPFINILDLKDICANNRLIAGQLVDICFNASLLHLLESYLRPGFILDSIQLLYSFAAGSEIRESQYWHKDYGSSKSIHLFIPISDMTEDSPFAVLSPKLSQLVGRRPWVRRISPFRMRQILGLSSFGSNLRAGTDIIAIDPARCYHKYASTRDHVALFITYNARPLYYRQDSSLLLAAQHIRQIALENYGMAEDLVDQILLT
jgi:hypothetical protein